MKRYFTAFYKELETGLNYFIPKLQKNMTELLWSERRQNSYYQRYRAENNGELPLFIVNSYRTAAENFQVIDSLASSVLVPYDTESKQIIAQLNGDESIEDLSRLLRQAQQYSINLFYFEMEQLSSNDGIVSLLDGKILALKDTAYNEQYGLDLDNDSRFDISMH